MKRILCILILTVFVCSAFVQADDSLPPHQYTTPPSSGRFEILQSSIAAMWTFRLDRYYGRVWQLVKTNDDNITWEEMLIIDLPKIKTATNPRFQLFTSGLAARHTFLIDNETGNTWVVVKAKRQNKDGGEYEINIWQPFAK